MQRPDNSVRDNTNVRPPTAVGRMMSRARAVRRVLVRRLRALRSAMAFAFLLAVVGVVLFSPLLLDDLAFRASHMLRPSLDAIAITDPVVVSEKPRLRVVSGLLSMPPALSGQARTGEALAALVKGGGARLALVNPLIVLDLARQGDERGGETGRPLPAFAEAISPIISALEDTAFETLIIRDGTLRLLTGDGIVETLEAVSAEVSVKRKTALRIKGTAVVRGELVALDATFGARIDRRTATWMPVKAQITSSPFNVSLDGRLELGDPMTLVMPSVDVAITNLRSVARWLGHVWPSGPGLRNFTARGSAEWNGKTISFQKGTFELDGNSANGALALTFGNSRPSVAGTLAFDEIDVGPYLVGWTAASSSEAAVSGSSGRSLISHLKGARDLTLPLMGMINADVRMSAQTTVLGSWRAGRSAVSVSLRDGQLVANLADLVLGDGTTVMGDVIIEGSATAPDYTLYGRIDGVELGALTDGLVGAPLLRGKGQIVIDLKGQGRAGMDVLSRLNGQIGLSMPDGGSATCTVRELAASAAGAPFEGCRTSTTMKPFKAAATSTNGVFTAENVEAQSGSDVVRVDGTLDLVTSIMKLKVTSTTPASGIAVPGEAAFETPIIRETVLVQGRPEEVQITVPPRIALPTTGAGGAVN